MIDKKYTIEELELKAVEIRQDIIKMLEAAGSGHSAGPLGLMAVHLTNSRFVTDY